MIDPIASALEAIASRFHNLAGTDFTLKARRGWPEHAQDLDLSSGPVVTVSRGATPRAERCSPRAVRAVPVADSPNTAILYRVALLYLDVQVDLWAPYRATRDDFAALVEQRAANDLPRTSSLRLVSTHYHGRPLTVDLVPVGAEDERDAATVGEWRQTWRASVVTDLVVEVTHPRQLDARLQDAVTHHGIELT